jgi:long-chain fatty acid transport protein
MKKFVLSVVAALAVVAISAPAFATNGTNIIGVGAISRSMGGVGAAAPQDAISAVFANPAAMCYIPCETSEVDFAATIFDPTVKAEANTNATGALNAKSQGSPYAFPAIGIYTPINEKWRFGLAAYGVSGLGVDYKDTSLATIGTTFGMAQGTDIRTQLSIMKFAPNVAYMINDKLSVGAALQINWAQLDLGSGDSHDYGFGTQVGVIYKPVDGLSLGATYQSPQKHTFKRVFNFNDNSQAGAFLPVGQTDNNRDTLALEQPQQVVVAAAYDIIPNTLLMEVDGKWLNWGGAKGYKDFDWEDQYVIAVGTQYKPVDWLAIRAGYNYGNNPVKEHNGWFATAPQGGYTSLQGTPVNNFFYEYFRVVGFPAVAEHHITAGLGVNITPKVSLNAGYMHAFSKKISETSAALPALFGGGTIDLASKLSEDSYEFGLNIMF